MKTHLKHKTIPEKYTRPIEQALSHYPELENVEIEFRIKNKHPVPYGTMPSMFRLFAPGRRRYVISLLEDAPAPIYHALFKNLQENMQVAVIAHELGHVVQFESLSAPRLLAFLISFSNQLKIRDIEREADRFAIEHGLGEGLYQHAIYIRSIPGYLEERPEININYLKPHEILQGFTQMQTGSIGV